MSIRIRMNKRQVAVALTDFLRSKGLEPISGVSIEKIATMDDYHYEAWAWCEKIGEPIVEEG